MSSTNTREIVEKKTVAADGKKLWIYTNAPLDEKFPDTKLTMGFNIGRAEGIDKEEIAEERTIDRYNYFKGVAKKLIGKKLFRVQRHGYIASLFEKDLPSTPDSGKKEGTLDTGEVEPFEGEVEKNGKKISYFTNTSLHEKFPKTTDSFIGEINTDMPELFDFIKDLAESQLKPMYEFYRGEAKKCIGKKLFRLEWTENSVKLFQKDFHSVEGKGIPRKNKKKTRRRKKKK